MDMNTKGRISSPGLEPPSLGWGWPCCLSSGFTAAARQGLQAPSSFFQVPEVPMGIGGETVRCGDPGRGDQGR